MKICQIVASAFTSSGGLEKHFIDQCNLLSCRPNICLTAVGHPDFVPFLDDKVRFIPMDLSRGRFNVIALLQLLRVLRRENFDIVHTHANKATEMVGKLRPYFSSSHVATLHSLKKNVGMFRYPDHVICVSNRIAHNIKNPHVSLIYNGVKNTEITFEPGYLQREFGLPYYSNVVASVGRLVYVKGFDLLLKAFSGLNGYLLIVGDGPELSKLKALASTLGSENQVVFSGLRTDVRKILRHSNFAVIASRREGFSYVMAEALLSHCPLISTDVADIRSIVGDRYCVMPDDVDGLREKIRSALADSEHLRKDFSSSFAFAAHEFSVETMIRKTCDVYDEVMQRKVSAAL